MTDQRKLIPKAARVGVAAISPSIGGPTTNDSQPHVSRATRRA